MYSKYRKLLFIFSLIIIAGCDLGCIGSNELGDEGEIDKFYVRSNSNQCSYSIGFSVDKSVHSDSIRNCLEHTTPKDAGASTTLLSILKDKGEDNGDTKTSVCSKYDNYAGISSIDGSIKDGIDTGNTTTADNLRKIFDVCLEYCQVKCFSDNGFSSSSVRSTNGGWVKNELYSNDSYYGITIDENSVININVSDKIFLSGAKEKKIDFINYYHKNGSADSYIPVGSNGNLGFVYPTTDNDSYFTNVNNYVSIINELRKNYIKINEYKNDLGEKQAIYYTTIKDCSYSKDENSYIVDSSSLGSQPDFGYSLEVFDIGNKDFYYYYQAPAILDKLKYGVSDDEEDKKCKFYGINNNDDSNEGFAIDYSDNKSSYELTYNNYSVGYIWALPEASTANSNSFTFEIEGPTKLAFKFADNMIYSYTNDDDNGCTKGEAKELNCNYKISYTERKTESGKTEEIEFKIDTTANNLNDKWYVLKKGNSTEVVLGETYDISYLESSRSVTISTDNPACASGLIISKLPLKEYKVEKSGYAFFHIPEYSGNDKLIYYNIVNSGAFALSDNTDIATNYYEFTPTSSAPTFGEYYFDNIKPLPKGSENDKTGLYSLNEDGIGKEKEYGFYVRKGQIIRFDYTSWLTIDGQGSVSLKTWNYQRSISGENTTFVSVPFGLNLLLLIQERPAYLCSGTKEETINADSFCKMMGGSMEAHQTPEKCTDADVTNQICKKVGDYKLQKGSVVYSKNNKCMADFSSISECNFNSVYNAFYKYNYNFQEEGEGVNKTCTKDGVVVDCSIIPAGTVYGPMDIYSNILSLMPQKNGDNYCITFKCTARDNNDSCTKYECDDANFATVKGIINDYITKLKTCTTKISNDSNYEISGFSGTLTDVGTDAASVKTSLDSITKYLGGGSFSVKIPVYDPATGQPTGNETTTTIDIEPTAAVFLKMSTTGNGFLQCYTLEEYSGSMYYFNIKNPSTHNTTLDVNLNTLGVKNLKSFLEANNGGLADAFTSKRKYTGNDSSLANKMLFETSFIANKSIYLSTYVLNDKIPLKLSEYSFGEPIRTLLLNAQTSITTGDRLEIFMASNLLNSTDLFNGNGNLKDSDKIKWLIKYDGDSIDESNSLYKFDKGGNLVEKGGLGVGINLKNGTDNGISQFIKDQKTSGVHDLVLYFKIKDIDNVIENNSGQYYIKMTNYAANKNYVADAFKILIDEVLSLMDGRSFNLQKYLQGEYVPCQGVGTCYIYSDKDVKNTGTKCQKDDTNCFASCDSLSADDDFSTKCKYIYNNGGFLKLIYKYIIADTTYQFLIKLCLIAMLVFYGFGYFLGLNNFTQEELVKRMIRIVFVYTLISPFGWEIYDKYIVSFFKQGIDSLLYLIASGFEVGNSAVIDTYLMRGDFTDRNILFSSGYDNLKLIFSRPIFNKILGLVFSGWFGPIYFYLVLSAVISYCVGFISAIIMYISIQVFMSIILAIGPLIFFFLFFEKTKGTFDKWLDMLISFALQQIFIILTLSFFNSLIFMVIKHVFAYTVCWSSILPMSIFGSTLSLISFWKVPTSSTSASALDLQAAAKNGPGLYNILLFYIIGTLMGKFVTNMADLANGLAGGVGITGFSNKITSQISNAGNQLKGLTKKGLKAPLNHANRKLNDWNKNVNDEYDKRKANRTRPTDNKKMKSSDEKDEKKSDVDNFSEPRSDENKDPTNNSLTPKSDTDIGSPSEPQPVTDNSKNDENNTKVEVEL